MTYSEYRRIRESHPLAAHRVRVLKVELCCAKREEARPPSPEVQVLTVEGNLLLTFRRRCRWCDCWIGITRRTQSWRARFRWVGILATASEHRRDKVSHPRFCMTGFFSGSFSVTKETQPETTHGVILISKADESRPDQVWTRSPASNLEQSLKTGLSWDTASQASCGVGKCAESVTLIRRAAD